MKQIKAKQSKAEQNNACRSCRWGPCGTSMEQPPVYYLRRARAKVLRERTATACETELLRETALLAPTTDAMPAKSSGTLRTNGSRVCGKAHGAEAWSTHAGRHDAHRQPLKAPQGTKKHHDTKSAVNVLGAR